MAPATNTTTVRVRKAHAKPAPVLSARDVLDQQVSEKQLQQNIINLARKCGYYVYHTWNSQHSEKGFPDLTIVAEQLIFIEVKDEFRKVTPEQRDILHRLRRAGCVAIVARPHDWPMVEHMLLSGRWQEAAS